MSSASIPWIFRASNLGFSSLLNHLPPTSHSTRPSSTPGCTTPPLRPLSRTPSPSRGERCWLLAAGLLTLPFLIYVFVVARRAHTPARFNVPHPMGFGLVIDAGPTGSRIHVFEFLNEGRIPFVGLDYKGSVLMKVRPGLQEFAAELVRERGVRSMGYWSSPGKGSRKLSGRPPR